MELPRLRVYRGPSAPAGPWLKGAELLNIRGDFGCVRDSQGASQFSVFLPSLIEDDPARAQEWVDNWRDPSRDYTHAIFAPAYGYAGVLIPGRDYDPEVFVDRMVDVLNMGIAPCIWLSDIPAQWQQAIGVVKALIARGLLPYVILMPACEPVGSEWWTSKQLNDLTNEIADLCDACGQAYLLGMHLRPKRAAMSSHPFEIDDPWAPEEGSESRSWKEHCGPRINGPFFYQMSHDDWTEAGCSDDDLANWFDVVIRMGKGHNGWRVMANVCLSETCLYNDIRNQFGPNGESVARDNAARLLKVATDAGVPASRVTFLNGAPRA